MARPSLYTESEDRIILRHANKPASVVNAALVRAGFGERTAEQLSQRRYYLRRRRPVARIAGASSNAIIALEAERHEVLNEIMAIDNQRAKLEQRLQQITDALVNQMTKLQADMAKVQRGNRSAASLAPADTDRTEPPSADADLDNAQEGVTSPDGPTAGHRTDSGAATSQTREESG